MSSLVAYMLLLKFCLLLVCLLSKPVRCAWWASLVRSAGTVYISGDNHRDLLNDAYCMFSQVNPLHADLFPSARRMEAEVVAMTASLLGGGINGVSTVRERRLQCQQTAPDSMGCRLRAMFWAVHNP